MADEKSSFISLFNVFFSPCCIKCEEMNRNTRNRFTLSTDGSVCCKTYYCVSCKMCIKEWNKIKDNFIQKTSTQEFSEDATDELEKFFWTLSHSKRGYMSNLCEICYHSNQANENRFILNSDDTLTETLSYCNDCVKCNYECTEAYRNLIAKKNSEAYKNIN